MSWLLPGGTLREGRGSECLKWVWGGRGFNCLPNSCHCAPPPPPNALSQVPQHLAPAAHTSPPFLLPCRRSRDTQRRWLPKGERQALRLRQAEEAAVAAATAAAAASSATTAAGAVAAATAAAAASSATAAADAATAPVEPPKEQQGGVQPIQPIQPGQLWSVEATLSETGPRRSEWLALYWKAHVLLQVCVRGRG